MQYIEITGSFRSSHRRCSVKKGVLRNFAKFTGKHLCQGLLFNKVAGQARPATLLKKSLWHRCFPVNFAKFLRTPFLQNTSVRLLLKFNENNFNQDINNQLFSEQAKEYASFEKLFLSLLEEHTYFDKSKKVSDNKSFWKNI